MCAEQDQVGLQLTGSFRDDLCRVAAGDFCRGWDVGRFELIQVLLEIFLGDLFGNIQVSR